MLDQIQVLTHSSIRIACPEGVVYCDPFQIQTDAHDADYILVTHDHYDHFSVEDIGKIGNRNTVLVVPEAMAQKAKEAERLVGSIATVRPGEQKTIGALSLETVPAYNTLKPFHPKSARWVGYIIISGGKRIYIAGDTDANEDNKTVSCDIALVPIGGTYTMDAKKAAEFVNILQPAIAIPTHYGNIVGKPQDADVFASLVHAPTVVERKISF